MLVAYSKKLNNKGMTLVEISVSIVIAIIFIGIIGSIYLTTTKYQGGYEEKKNAGSIVDGIFELTSNKIKYSTCLYISNNDNCPPGWENYNDSWSYVYFDSLSGENGYVGYGTNGIKTDNIYGDEYYRNGRLAVSVEADSTAGQYVDLIIDYYNSRGDNVYSREGRISLINLVNSNDTVSINGDIINNENAPVYIHYRTDSQMDMTAGLNANTGQNRINYPAAKGMDEDVNELIIWKGIRSAYESQTAIDARLYCPDQLGEDTGVFNDYNLLQSNTFNNLITGESIGTFALSDMPLIWQYGVTNLGWTANSYSSNQYLGKISKTTLTNWGISGEGLYLLPYHYFGTVGSCDLLLYTSTDYNWKPFNGSQTANRQTNLVYHGGENYWYYFKKTIDLANPGTRGIEGSIVSLKVVNQDGTETEIDGPIVDYGTVLKYVDDKGNEKTLIVSKSSQIYAFFKCYGTIK